MKECKMKINIIDTILVMKILFFNKSRSLSDDTILRPGIFL